jgi:hypothetical protein
MRWRRGRGKVPVTMRTSIIARILYRRRVRQPSLLRSLGWQAVGCEVCPPKPCAKAGVRHRPCSLVARGTPYSLLRPSNKSRGWRAKWRVMQFKSHLLIEGVAPLGAPSRHLPYSAGPRFRGPFRLALRLEARGAFRVNRSHRASGKSQRPAVSQLLAGVPSDPGRSPGAARVQEERSSPARGRRIRSRQHHAS